MGYIQPHLMCGPGDVAKYVFLPGDPKRAQKIAEKFDRPRKVAENREYITFTGSFEGIPVSVTSTGIGCPSAAIAVEELANVGAECLIRVGTTGAIQGDIETGDIVIATGAVRNEGTSKAYAPIEFPAMASPEVVSALISSAKKLNASYWVGIVRTTDVFYEPYDEHMRLWTDLGVLSVEMEASTIFTVASARGLKAGAILAVDGNLVKGTEKAGFKPGEEKGELDPRLIGAVDLETMVALRAVKILEKEARHGGP